MNTPERGPCIFISLKKIRAAEDKNALDVRISALVLKAAALILKANALVHNVTTPFFY